MRRKQSLSGLASSFLLLLLSSANAHAAGRTEINQAVIDAAGGFPYAISAPGNYVLTGSLTVPASTDAFLLSTNDVVFDLNGFTIAGPATCTTASCPSGSGTAIGAFSGIAHRRRVTVKNGTIRGFASSCLSLNAQARVDDLLVLECGRFGIAVSSAGIVTNNRVLQTGEAGIRMTGTTHESTYGSNTVAEAGLGAASWPAVSGGRSSGGNTCDDGSCSAWVARSFYLTNDSHTGGAADDACDVGFHMASLWEIRDPSNLRYDARGETNSDSGSGPPSLSYGWIRTGYSPTFGSNGGAGRSSCDGWTSNSLLEQGSRVILNSSWTSTTDSAPHTGAFAAIQTSCNTASRVWCVED